MLTKAVVYYSDCRPEARILDTCQRTIERSGLPIVAVTLAPIAWPCALNIVLPLERGHLAMFRQILAGLEATTSDVVFFAEHDVAYHPSHWAFTPPRRDTYYYNQNAWKVSATDGQALFYFCNQTSGLCADRALLVEHYRRRVAYVEAHSFSRRNGFEPGTRQIRHGGFDDVPFDTWMSPAPNIDIRHGRNLTQSRWRQDQFRNPKFCQGWRLEDGVPGWGQTKGRFDEWLASVMKEKAA